MNSIFYLSLLLVSISLVDFTVSKEVVNPEIECLDILSDFESKKWISSPNRYHYADTSENLPSQFRGKLIGDGIFYLIGNDQIPNQSFLKSGSHIRKNIKPGFMYIKYYGHLANSNDSKIYVHPARIPDTGFVKFVEPSSQFVWTETIIQINLDVAENDYLEFGAGLLQNGDYLFIDKIAVVYGAPFNINTIKNFCWSNSRRTFNRLAYSKQKLEY